MTRRLAHALSLSLLLAAACGKETTSTSLDATWSFSSGSCASLAVQTVHVTWGPVGGATQGKDVPCEAGGAALGTVEASGSYAVDAEGFDAGGVARAESFGAVLSFGSGAPSAVSVPIVLSPKRANVVVTWSMSTGGGCPIGVILPYYVTLHEPPAVPLGAQVASTQESCVTQAATLGLVPPGDYVVVLDSRAVTPKVYGKKLVTVVPGEDATVSFSF